MIPFIKPYYNNDDLMAVQEVLNSGWVAQGPKVEEFEERLADYLGTHHVITTTNCTMALTLALRALDIGPGDEVIVPDFTFPATAIAVANTGATPVLVDVDVYTYNMSPDLVEGAITDRTKAIIPVHLFGLAADIERIIEIADGHMLRVVEDAACALGAKTMAFGDNQRMVGAIGDIGCFSLHASKGITTGEGGIICTQSGELAEKMRRLSCFGDERAFRRAKNGAPFRFDPKSNNYKMSDIAAALGIAQLAKIGMLIDWRIKIATEWDWVIRNDEFLSENILHMPDLVYDSSHIYQSYVAVCATGKRPEVMAYMRNKGFQCGIGTHACSRYQEAFACQGGTGISDALYDNAISFPRYYGLEVKKEWENARA